ncbi:MAG: ABC-type transport auxiliary lipoprotein family protein [Oceanicaulis sp.]
MSRLIPALAALAALVAAPGCVSLLPEAEPTTLYRLDTAVTDAAPARAGEDIPVLIDRIAAPRGLAGDRIAIQRGDAIAYMAGARWIGPAPQLVESAVLDGFHATAPLIGPAKAEDGVDARYELALELRRFEAVYDQGEGAAPTVRAALRARLIDRDTRALVAAGTIEESLRAAENRQGAIVAAFSQVTDSVARELADWTQTEICASDGAPEACGG